MSSETPNPAAADEAMAAGDQAAPMNFGGQELQAALEEANNRALKAHAELENYRKRVRRELEDERKYAPLPLIRDLLGSIDNLDRAVSSVQENEANKGLLEGVKMVLAQILATLEKHHCRRISTVGHVFDPHMHEAIAQEPSDLEAGMVAREVGSGYMLHERVVRPAQVTVAVEKPV
jgi:molecular chaperone GrpE